MANLYIITGPAGVGKSTVSKSIAKKKKKSVLIEGDDIYNQVIGGRVSPWKEGNHLDLFWEICTQLISTYLEHGYDVIFNYIVNPENFYKLKSSFEKYTIKFVVLIVSKEILIERDKQRPEDCRMNERCLVLLDNFLKRNYGKDYFLDTSSLSIDEVIQQIESNNQYLCN